MAYKYEKVNQQLLVPQIEDQLLMYIQEKNIAIGSVSYTHLTLPTNSRV